MGSAAVAESSGVAQPSSAVATVAHFSTHLAKTAKSLIYIDRGSVYSVLENVRKTPLLRYSATAPAARRLRADLVPMPGARLGGGVTGGRGKPFALCGEVGP